MLWEIAMADRVVHELSRTSSCGWLSCLGFRPAIASCCGKQSQAGLGGRELGDDDPRLYAHERRYLRKPELEARVVGVNVPAPLRWRISPRGVAMPRFPGANEPCLVVKRPMNSGLCCTHFTTVSLAPEAMAGTNIGVPFSVSRSPPGRLNGVDDGISMNLIQLSAWP